MKTQIIINIFPYNSTYHLAEVYTMQGNSVMKWETANNLLPLQNGKNYITIKQIYKFLQTFSSPKETTVIINRPGDCFAIQLKEVS